MPARPERGGNLRAKPLVLTLAAPVARTHEIFPQMDSGQVILSASSFTFLGYIVIITRNPPLSR